MKHIAIAAALSLTIAAPALAGPPWLTVEVRPSFAPFLVVRTWHHGTANPMPLRGTAEGLVDGRRVSVPLRLDPLSDGNNAYGIVQTWSREGVWVLSVATQGEAHGGAAAVVLIDRNGAATVRFPRMFDGRTREATTREIEAMLRALDAGASPQLARTGWKTLGARMALPLILLGLLVFLTVRFIGRLVARLWMRERPAAA